MFSGLNSSDFKWDTHMQIKVSAKSQSLTKSVCMAAGEGKTD